MTERRGVTLTCACRSRCNSLILARRSSVLIFITSNFSASTGLAGNVWNCNVIAVSACRCGQFKMSSLPSHPLCRCRPAPTFRLHRPRLRLLLGHYQRVWRSFLWGSKTQKQGGLNQQLQFGFTPQEGQTTAHFIRWKSKTFSAKCSSTQTVTRWTSIGTNSVWDFRFKGWIKILIQQCIAMFQLPI